MNKEIYLSFHNRVFDSIIRKKRIEILQIIKEELKQFIIKDCLDVGTTPDNENKSSNFIVKNLEKNFEYKSYSNCDIEDPFFLASKNGSITDSLSSDLMNYLKSDVVLSSATIEHVGSYENQKKMIKNVALLTNKIFFITTPNKNYPIDFHSKLPIVNMLPNNIFRKILKLFNFEYLSKEENLNLLSLKDLKNFLSETKVHEDFDIKIKHIRLFFMKSNFIIIGTKKTQTADHSIDI